MRDIKVTRKFKNNEDDEDGYHYALRNWVTWKY